MRRKLHKWATREWPDRERTCTECGVRARRYGIGRDSYWGYIWPGEEAEEFPGHVPPCNKGEA